MDNQSIFEADELEADALTPEATEEQVEEAAQAPARDDRGRFAPKAEEEPGHDPDAPEDDAKAKTVPQGALHAERERRKGVEAELATAREQLAQIAELRRKAAERQPAALPAADDPAALDHLRNRIAEIDQRQTQADTQRTQEQLDHYEVQQLASVMAQSEAAFRQETPDYDDAINYVIEARARELQLYGMDPVSIQQAISGEITEIARTAIQQGKNPADIGYQIAQARGYRPAQVQQQQGGGAAAAQVAAIAKAQQAGKTLGSGGGSSAATLNANSIAALSDDEFEALYATPEGRALIDAL